VIIHDSAVNILRRIIEMHPGALEALEASKGFKPGLKDYQAAALFGLARAFNYAGAQILEMGTAIGYSASILAQGAPLARIVTLDPAEAKAELARQNLAPWPNVHVVTMRSVDYLAQIPSYTLLDMVFVDGDHLNIALDVPWFNHLKVGGLLLCHDYTPNGRAGSPVIYAELNRVSARLGRTFDVSLIDETEFGMVGFCRLEGETV
jgi:predicted O-methyltransferase YrrM